MRVVIGGASGMIGSELERRLRQRGDEVIALVRRPPRSAAELEWDPAAGRLDASRLRGADAVVSLSGASIGRLPWTRAYRAEILGSRLSATRAIVRALRELDGAGSPVPTLVSASAVGYYGSRPGVELDEGAAAGDDFLAGVVTRWEAATAGAPPSTRVALARSGIVIGEGGTVAVLRRLARLGLAGPLGSGRQHWPWISLRDEASALIHLLDSDTVSGPVNLVGPTPASAAEVVRAIAHRLRRPYWLPAPAAALTLALGDAARTLMLADQWVSPRVLLATGFRFADETVQSAIEQLAR